MTRSDMMRLGRWASAVCGLALIALSAASVAGNLLAVDLGSGFLKVRFSTAYFSSGHLFRIAWNLLQGVSGGNPAVMLTNRRLLRLLLAPDLSPHSAHFLL